MTPYYFSTKHTMYLVLARKTEFTVNPVFLSWYLM